MNRYLCGEIEIEIDRQMVRGSVYAYVYIYMFYIPLLRAVSSVGCAVVFGLSFGAFLRLLLWVVFVDCIGTGIVIATILWCDSIQTDSFDNCPFTSSPSSFSLPVHFLFYHLFSGTFTVSSIFTSTVNTGSWQIDTCGSMSHIQWSSPWSGAMLLMCIATPSFPCL